MYVEPLKTILIEALKGTFDVLYPVAEFRNVHIDMEYPVDEQDYPSLWIDFDDTKDLMKAGISHKEFIDPETDNPADPFTRWEFGGYVSITAVAMTSLERDRLFDEVVRVVAFGREDPTLGRFWQYIDNNDLIGMNISTDKISPRGNAAAPGTPWSTDELMYEKSLNLELIGEFYPDLGTATLVPLSQIKLLPQMDLSGDLGYPAPEAGFSNWH